MTVNLAAKIKPELETAKTNAREAWSAFATKRDEAKASASADDLMNPESEVFKALDASKKVHTEAAQRVEQLQARHDELVNLDGEATPEAPQAPTGEQRLQIEELAAVMQRPGLDTEAAAKRVIQSAAYKELQDSGVLLSGSGLGGTKHLGEAFTRRELKAALTYGGQSTGGVPFIDPQRDGVELRARRELSVLDLISIVQTSSDSIDYVKQTSFTNSAAPTPEATATSSTGFSNAQAPESAIAFSKVNTPVVEIKHFIPVTKRAAADATELADIIEDEMVFGVREEAEDQVISGDGTGENLTGVLEESGIGEYTLDSEPVPDAVHKGITLALVANEKVTAIGMNANTWEAVRLEKDDNGNYLMGPPNLPGPRTLFGYPIFLNNGLDDGDAVPADWSTVRLYVREGVQTFLTDSNRDWFEHGILALLASARMALAVRRPAAIVKVDGLTA